MMEPVPFNFEVGQTVLTPFGDIGIIDMQGKDDGGVKYFVKTSVHSAWWKEHQLSDKPLVEHK